MEPHRTAEASEAAGTPLLALVTHPVEGAEAFARRLVEQRLAACVNRVDVASVYRFEGAIHDEPEVLLLLKTSAERRIELEAFLRREHPYDVPELIALNPAAVEAGYLAWWRDALS